MPQLAQHKLSRLKVSQDQMDREELLNTTLIWQNVFIVDSVKLLVQLMLLSKNPTFKIQQWLIKNYFTINKNFWLTEIDGSRNLREISKVKLEVDQNTYVRYFYFQFSNFLILFWIYQIWVIEHENYLVDNKFVIISLYMARKMKNMKVRV